MTWIKVRWSGDERSVLCSVNLKSGLVNFIRPCSVAIFRAMGTASSHLDRTHSLSHLEGEQPIRTLPERRRWRSLKWRTWSGTLTWSGSLSSYRCWDHKLLASSSRESEEGQPEGTRVSVSEADCGGLKWTGVNLSRLWWTEIGYLMKQEGQELDHLVGRQCLQVWLFKAAQVLIFCLKGSEDGSWTLNIITISLC